MKLRPIISSEMKQFEAFSCENFPVTLETMMQEAGKGIYDWVMEYLNEMVKIQDQVRNDKRQKILIVCGKGNNGGDALVAARLLHEKGIHIQVLSFYPDSEFSKMAKQEMKKVRELGISIHGEIGQSRFHKYDLIIDALFGFSLSGDPRPPTNKIINQINKSGVPILSIDVPSGFDCEIGQVMNPIVNATYTLCLGMLKFGLREHSEVSGKLFLGSLGIPEIAYQELGYDEPIFFGKSTIPID